ncbi:MAG: DNA polymerase [Stenomitos frigidus ULC029]
MPKVISRQPSLFPELEVELDPAVVLPGSPLWHECISEWVQCDLFGFDLETYGAEKQDGLKPWQGEIRLIQIGLPSGRVLIADLGGFQDDRAAIEAKLRKQGFFTILKERLENRKVRKIMQGGSFDMLWVYVKYGIRVRELRDTMLMSQLLWAGLSSKYHKWSHSLGAICGRLGLAIDKTEQKSEWGWELSNNQLNYACRDSQVLHPAYHKLQAMIDAAGLYGSAMCEFGAATVFTEMEYRGFPVNQAKLLEAIALYEAAVPVVLKPFTDAFPGVSPNSSDQVVAAIKERFGIALTITDEDGEEKDSSGADVLASHLDNPVIKAISLYRSLCMYLNYLKGCREAYFDGAVRGHFSQLGPKGFGRSTCGSKRKDRQRFPNVNLQNPPNPVRMPKELRYGMNLPVVRGIFEAPPGYKLIVADLSQAHSRISAECSGDQDLINSYLLDEDIHCYTAARLAELEGLGGDWKPESIKKWAKDKSHSNHKRAKELRTAAKSVHYGSLNCQGGKTLQATVKTDAGVEMSLDQAKGAIKFWKEKFSTLAAYQQQVHRTANTFSETFPGINATFAKVVGFSGRRLYLEKRPAYFDGKPDECKLTDAVSFVWTSTEADVVKMGMAWVQKHTDAHPEWDAWCCNCAHDELDYCVKEEYALDLARVVFVSLQAAMKVFLKVVPADEADAKPEAMICNSWQDK